MTVSAGALRQVLQALNGPGYRIAELQGMVASLRAQVAPDCAARDLWVRTRDGQRRIAIDRIDWTTRRSAGRWR